MHSHILRMAAGNRSAFPGREKPQLPDHRAPSLHALKIAMPAKPVINPFSIWKPEKPAFSGEALRTLLKSPRVGPDCIVPEFLYRGKTTIFYGDPSIGKTTIAICLGVQLAAGLPVFDRLLTKPSRVYFMLFETEPAEVAESLTSLASRFPIHEDQLSFDTETIGMDCSNPQHVEEIINRVNLFKPDAIIIDPLFMLVPGGLSKDEPSSNVVRFLRRLSHDTNAAIMPLHHGKKEQFEKGQKVPGSYYGTIWLKAHCRIMWEVQEGADKSRVLTKRKDNLGVCRETITLHYDHQSCACSMAEEGDQTAKGRLIGHLAQFPAGHGLTSGMLADQMKISIRTLKTLFNDPDVLRLVDMERRNGCPTIWKIKGQPPAIVTTPATP